MKLTNSFCLGWEMPTAILCFPAREGRAPPLTLTFRTLVKNWYQSKRGFLGVSGNADTKARGILDFLLKKSAALWYPHLADNRDRPKVVLNLHVLPVAKITRFSQKFLFRCAVMALLQILGALLAALYPIYEEQTHFKASIDFLSIFCQISPKNEFSHWSVKLLFFHEKYVFYVFWRSAF